MARRSIKIPWAVKFRIWAMPCTVCGVPYSIHIDHIIPVTKGGTDDEANLQPLCSYCNHRKHNRRTNAEVCDWVLGRGLPHFVTAVYDHDTRYCGYDRPTQYEWERAAPDRMVHARALHRSFVLRCEVD
jgi:hypothetical protein